MGVPAALSALFALARQCRAPCGAMARLVRVVRVPVNRIEVVAAAGGKSMRTHCALRELISVSPLSLWRRRRRRRATRAPLLVFLLARAAALALALPAQLLAAPRPRVLRAAPEPARTALRCRTALRPRVLLLAAEVLGPAAPRTGRRSRLRKR